MNFFGIITNRRMAGTIRKQVFIVARPSRIDGQQRLTYVFGINGDMPPIKTMHMRYGVQRSLPDQALSRTLLKKSDDDDWFYVFILLLIVQK